MPTDTFSVLASGDDGRAGASDTVYPPEINLTSDAAGVNVNISKRETFAAFRTDVGLIRFDTSTLPDAAVVSKATLRLNVISKVDNEARSIVAEWYASSNWPIDTTDYSSTVVTDAHAGTTIASIATGADQDFALQNLSNISLTGYTGLRLHVTGGAPATDQINELIVALFDHATLAEPRLLVTYDDEYQVPAVYPPAKFGPF
ncbi:MAG: hypothetical protein H0U82_00290 [Actinobacteria bacterium]|nr:hypothetical protein [Actinomycetota bacterium]